MSHLTDSIAPAKRARMDSPSRDKMHHIEPSKNNNCCSSKVVAASGSRSDISFCIDQPSSSKMYDEQSGGSVKSDGYSNWSITSVLDPEFTLNEPEFAKFYVLETNESRLISGLMKLLLETFPLASPEWDHLKRVRRLTMEKVVEGTLRDDGHATDSAVVGGSLPDQSINESSGIDKSELNSKQTDIPPDKRTVDHQNHKHFAAGSFEDADKRMLTDDGSAGGIKVEKNESSLKNDDKLNIGVRFSKPPNLNNCNIKLVDTKFQILITEIGNCRFNKQDVLHKLQSGFALKSAEFPIDLQNFNISTNVHEMNIPRCSPLSISQFTSWSCHWPLNFHKNERFELLLSGAAFFDEAERVSIVGFMRKAIDNALLSNQNDQLPIGCVVVDPSTSHIVASTFDQRNGIVATGKSSNEIVSDRNMEPIAFRSNLSDCSRAANGQMLSGNFAPIRHAVMCAIDLTARSQGGGAWKDVIDARCLKDANDSVSSTYDPASASPKPYICVGLDCFVTHEPCTMCAMALLHSRIRRVFFGVPRLKNGALGSSRRLHTDKQLNHRFDVWKLDCFDEPPFDCLDIPLDVEI